MRYIAHPHHVAFTPFQPHLLLLSSSIKSHNHNAQHLPTPITKISTYSPRWLTQPLHVFLTFPLFFFFFPFKKKILKYDNKLPPKTRSRVKRGSHQYFKDKFQFVFFILNLSFSKISMISRFYFTKNSSFQTRNLW